VIKRHTRGDIRYTSILNDLVLTGMTASKELVVIQRLKCWFSFCLSAVLSGTEMVHMPRLMYECKNTGITSTLTLDRPYLALASFPCVV
jgi:hypothetical protein